MICSEDKNIYKPYLKLVDFAVDKFLKKGTKPVLLDAGCGHSSVLEDIYRKCQSTIGVDMDREGLELNPLIDRKICGALTNIPVQNNSVDIITSAWVFEHIEKPSEFLNEMNRILTSKGYLIFIAPNRKSWFAIIASLIPQKAHGLINKLLYKRSKRDTFPKYYKLNTEKDIDEILVNKFNYKKIEFRYNDDPKYLGFSKLTKPLAGIWNRIAMKDKYKRLRVHILGLYQKP